MFSSYIAIGDSFTEGLGDERLDGTLRGWADRVAEAIAYHRKKTGLSTPFQYANLAIRGRKIAPVIEEQVAPAIAQKPELVSFNAGGNDILRPGFDPRKKLDQIFEAVDTIRDAGSHVLLLAGPNAGHNIPLGNVFSARGSLYTKVAAEKTLGEKNLTFVDNFSDPGFSDSSYWSEDGLHLSTAGHLRVAANVVDALHIDYPPWWGQPRDPKPDPKTFGGYRYFRSYIAPWVGRRLTGRSSGDGRSAKRPTLTNFEGPTSEDQSAWWRPPQ